jgi:hypothetical protein
VPVDPLAREQLAALAVARDGAVAASGRDERGACAQLVDECLDTGLPAGEVVRVLEPA